MSRKKKQQQEINPPYKMKTIRITAPGKTETVETEKPALSAGQVLLKVAYVGFCGSDLNTFRGLNPLVSLPVVPGHEIGAVIESVAEEVPSHLRPGMSATVNPYTGCGHCPACRNGRANACAFNQTLGIQRDGAMAEYLLAPWEKVIADDAISVRNFALVEPLSVGFHAVDRAEATDTDTVLIFGCGMIGLGAIVRAVLRGARVIAVDVDDKKLALARRLGAASTVNSCREDLHERIRGLTDGAGADVVIEAVGRPETYIAAITEAAFTGRVVYIGYAKDRIAFDTSLFVKKELDIRGSRNATARDFGAVMAALKRATWPVDELISAVYTPQEAQTALETWAAEPGHVIRIFIQF
jgi:threonine dehydrogenase-like Zn-dependent dehydrogenase